MSEAVFKGLYQGLSTFFQSMHHFKSKITKPPKIETLKVNLRMQVPANQVTTYEQLDQLDKI